ncbi:probable E3 ubiquitin-protein ligase MID2 [Saccostrea echinata]|uniref:probable E3 ubiquitin-protein ligase MID2 n=1 Tax=Saccostrea echinata TaxID=191078 RepID=UPI002A83A3B6|nr:probable E3 ubiquitin-protein ligase MID2 [Saccostrea echinata]
MAEAAIYKTVSDSFTCPICLERLTTAKYLSCLHSFCESCIQTYISSTVTRDSEKNTNFIVCPVCRKTVDEPEINISSEKWAKCLPVNKLIQTMNINSDTTGKNCTFCERDSKKVAATYWCKTCVEAICECCKHIHDLIPVLSSHRIVKLSDASHRNEPVDVDEPCRKHKGKLLEVFCEDHSKLCCSVCFATEHRRCASVISIEDASSQIDKEKLEKINKVLSELLESIDSAVLRNTQDILSLNAKKDSIMSSMANEVEKVKTLIENAHVQWLKHFEQAHKENTDKIEMSSDELKRFGTTVRDAKSLLSSVIDKGSIKQMFMSEHLLQAQVTSHFNRMNSLNIWEPTESYTQKSFDVLEQLKEVGKLHSIDILVKEKRTTDSMSDFVYEFTGKRNIPCSRAYLKEKDLMNIDFKMLSNFRLPDSVYFGLFLDETRILFSIESKSSLDVYDTLSSPWNCIHSEQCDGTPYGLSYGNNMNEVFVAFGTFVLKFEILDGGTRFNKLMKIDLTEKIEDFVHCPKVVFSANSAKRCFLSPDFSLRSSSSYKRIGDRAFVASSLTPGIFVYGKNDSVCLIDSEGSEISQFKLISGMPRGMAMDSENNIFVCKCQNDVEQIKFDGTSSRKVNLSINGENAYNIVFHPAGHKFLVICYMRVVGVYQIPAE